MAVTINSVQLIVIYAIIVAFVGILFQIIYQIDIRRLKKENKKMKEKLGGMTDAKD